NCAGRRRPGPNADRKGRSCVLDNLSLLFEFPPVALDVVLNGLLIGAIFALAAYGMALVWGVLNIVNVVQGELVVLGGYITFVAVQWGGRPLAGLPLSSAVMFCVGWLIYKAVIFRVVDRDIFISILATFGLSILIQQLANAVFGSDVRTVDAVLGSIYFVDGMVVPSVVKLLAFVLAVVAGAALEFFLGKSRLWHAIRAPALNPRAARILGIDTDRVFAATYALNAALCGAAGSLAVMAWTIHPYLGLPYTIRSFMVVVVAGVGNVGAVIAAGLGLGALENVAGFVLGVEFQIAFVFALMVVILVWRSIRAARKRSYLE